MRFGSAEIYSVVETFQFVGDSIVVGQRRPGKDEDERVLLFIKMRDPSAKLTNDHIQQLNQAIKKAFTSRHVPAHTFQCSDIPTTTNGKKQELAIKAVVNGNAAFKPSSVSIVGASDEEHTADRASMHSHRQHLTRSPWRSTDSMQTLSQYSLVAGLATRSYRPVRHMSL